MRSFRSIGLTLVPLLALGTILAVPSISAANITSATSAIPDIFSLACACKAATEDGWNAPISWFMTGSNIIATPGQCSDKVIITSPSGPPSISGCDQEEGCHFEGEVEFFDHLAQEHFTCSYDFSIGCGVTVSLRCFFEGNMATQGASCASCASENG
jgi:hypothetical protein